MKIRHTTAISSIVILGACTGPGLNGAAEPNTGFIKDLPEAVVAMAAPNQDLKAVLLMPEDRCFWYQHVGPVETTMLPLRSKRGNKICASPRPEPVATS